MQFSKCLEKERPIARSDSFTTEQRDQLISYTYSQFMTPEGASAGWRYVRKTE